MLQASWQSLSHKSNALSRKHRDETRRALGTRATSCERLIRRGNDSHATKCHFMPHNRLHCCIDELSAVMSSEWKSFGCWVVFVGAAVGHAVGFRLHGVVRCACAHGRGTSVRVNLFVVECLCGIYRRRKILKVQCCLSHNNTKGNIYDIQRKKMKENYYDFPLE